MHNDLASLLILLDLAVNLSTVNFPLLLECLPKLPRPFTHTPPGTSDEHLTVIKALANAKPDGAVIVTTPQEVAMATIRRELSFCRTMKLRVIGIVENMSGFSCPCCQVGEG